MGARMLRTPSPGEGVTCTGWGLADGMRLALDGNPDLDAPGLHALLERLELAPDPIPTATGPGNHILVPEELLVTDEAELFSSDGLMCSPDVFVVVAVPPALEGLREYLNAGGVRNPYVAVLRRHVSLIEDPGAYFPLDRLEYDSLLRLLGCRATI